MTLTGVVIRKEKAQSQDPKQPVAGTVVVIAVQPTPGSPAYTLPVLTGRDEARALDIDDEVTIMVERTVPAAPPEG